MNTPSDAQRDLVRRFLDLEGGSATREAASQVYDKLHAHLALLLGATGVRSLLRRSARLREVEFPELGQVGVVDSGAALATGLASLSAHHANDAAAALFATLLALLSTFIGDRLTREVLRGAWPDLDLGPSESVPKETEK
jgi:hypothetical protein